MRPTLLLIYIVTAAVEIVYSSEHTKRKAPLGFTGVRGKKSITDEDSSEVLEGLIGNVVDAQATTASDGGNVEKRAPSGFMGMRGKKPFSDPVIDEFADDVIKRAPSGFFGMRGKKDAEFDSLDEYKRGQYGFHGMRGKKNYENDDFLLESDKRAPNGFMGMRGKKAYIDEIKRAQMSNFYGMRGKKAKSGFFGMRGKKYPYELRGKFVGVRGKKSDEIEENNENQEYVDLNQLMLLLAANNRPVLGNGSSDLSPV